MPPRPEGKYIAKLIRLPPPLWAELDAWHQATCPELGTGDMLRRIVRIGLDAEKPTASDAA